MISPAARKEELLQKIVQQLNPSFINVVEFRHSSWWQTKVRETLSSHNISFCGISHPLLPDEAVVNACEIMLCKLNRKLKLNACAVGTPTKNESLLNMLRFKFARWPSASPDKLIIILNVR